MEEEEEDEEEDEEEEADEAPSPAKRTRSSMKVNAAKNDVADVNDLPGKICRCIFVKTVFKKHGNWKVSASGCPIKANHTNSCSSCTFVWCSPSSFVPAYFH